MACVGCVMGEARAGSVVGGPAVVTDERSYVGDNRTAAASVGDFIPVSRVVIDGEERYWHSYRSFRDIALVSLSGGGDCNPV